MANLLYIIAIDEYQDGSFPKLNNAKLDAERLIKVLTEKYGYDLMTHPLMDKAASRKNIIEGLNSLSSVVTEEDNLIIFYAGHGEIHKLTKKGYWVPNDASHAISDFIPNSTVIDLVEGIPAKHILLISDSCFSGTFLTQTRSGITSHSYDKLESTKSRWLLTSGREEKVSDGQPGVGSPFARAICEFFENTNDRHTVAGDMFNYVLKNTSMKTSQQAVLAHIESCGHEGGMIVFESNLRVKGEESEISKLTISYETAQKLMQIGIPQNAVFSYTCKDNEILLDISTKPGINKCSAFLAQELHDLIPERIDIDTNTYIAHATGYDRLTEEEVEEYHAAEVTMQRTDVIDTPYMAICRCSGRMVAFSRTEDGHYNNLISWGKNQAEALAEMILMLNEENKLSNEDSFV